MEIASGPQVVAPPAGLWIVAVTPRLCSRLRPRSTPSIPYVHRAGRLRDCASAVRSVIHPSCLPSQSLNVWPPITPGSSFNTEAGVTSPACSAAAYGNTLNDHPAPRQPSRSTPVRLIWPRIAALLASALPPLTRISPPDVT